jgi:hypothetical protein
VGLSSGSQPVLFDGLVGEGVASVELRYQDGVTERVEPVEGAVLAEISPPTHYEPGRRLVEAVALGPLGNEVARHPFDPTSKGAYPCKQPEDAGAGVEMCP